MSNQELTELFKDIELSTQVDILERVLKKPASCFCGETDIWDERLGLCYDCAKEHYT